MTSPSGDSLAELLERADAVAARYDAAIRRPPHMCEANGPCAPCREWDERLLEIERAERDRERTR
jgi:hypothetical protein